MVRAVNNPVYDEHGCFFGHEPLECGEHRTVGDSRAVCFDCSEWCYPNAPCVRCEIGELRAKAEQSDGQADG